MKLNISAGEIVTAKDDNKFLALAFKNNRLDSLGGYCKAIDFKRE